MSQTAVVADKDLAKLEYLLTELAPRRGVHVHYLDALPAMDNRTPHTSQHQATALPDLDELSLSPSAATSRQQLYADLLRWTPNLVGIDLLLPLNNPHRSPVIPILAHGFPQLKHLSLHGHSKGRLGAGWLGDLLARLGGLVEVELAWVEQDSRSTQVEDRVASALASLAKLRRLSLIQVSNFSPDWLELDWQGPVESVSLKWAGPSEDHALVHDFAAKFGSTLTSLSYIPAKPSPNFNHLAWPVQNMTPLSSPQLVHLPHLTRLSFHSPLGPAYLITFLGCPLASIKFTSAPHADLPWNGLLMILDGFEHTLDRLELRVGQPTNLSGVAMNDLATWCWRHEVQYRLERWEEGDEGRVVSVTD